MIPRPWRKTSRNIRAKALIAKSKYAALANDNAQILVTEWKELRSPDFMEIKMQMKNPIIFDGRNQYKARSLQKMGFEYYQIGVGTK